MNDTTSPSVIDTKKVQAFLAYAPQEMRQRILNSVDTQESIKRILHYLAPTLTGPEIDHLMLEALDAWRGLTL